MLMCTHPYRLLPHALFATGTLWWSYKVASTSQMRMRVDPIADETVSETIPLLPICGYNKMEKSHAHAHDVCRVLGDFNRRLVVR